MILQSHDELINRNFVDDGIYMTQGVVSLHKTLSTKESLTLT